jgi:hypothetical protein
MAQNNANANANAAAAATAANGAAVGLSLASDPKFDGSKGCKTSPEVWLRAMDNKKKVAGWTDRQAIDNAMRNLEGGAADFFYTALQTLRPDDYEAIMEDWTKWKDAFRTQFFREMSTADAAIDWNNLKQEDSEDAVGFFNRVAASVGHFINRTCGTLKGDDSRTGKTFTLRDKERTAQALKKEEWANSVTNRLATAQRTDPRLVGAAEPQEATDAYATFVTDTQKVMKEDIIADTTSRVYKTMQNLLSTALILKTLHAGLKYQKCREVVFQAMTKDSCDLFEVVRLLRSSEQDVEIQRNTFARQNRARASRINGVGNIPDEEDAGAEEPAHDVSTATEANKSNTGSTVSMEQITEMVVAALKQQQQKKIGFKGKCNNCDKFGHMAKDCRSKKKSGKESEN